jgi:hypothetical protein
MIRLLQGKIVSSRLEGVINHWDKIKFASFYPRNFLPWVKRIFLWYKKNQIKFSPKVDDVFSPRRLLTILPQEGWSLFTPRG